MMIGKLRRLSVALLLVIAPLTSFIVPGIAHAAGGTFTWSGAGADGNWSTAGNWVGGTAPVSGDVGDTIIINNAATFTHGSTDDLATLSLASLQFENNGSGSTNSIALANPLTISGTITQAASDTGTEDFIENSGSAQTITLGSDVTVTPSIAGFQFGSTPVDNIALAGHTLTFTDNGGGVASTVTINDNITGSGSVVYNGPASNYSLSGNNTYSGTTQVTASNLPISTNNNNAFGSSSISIATTSSISFWYNTTTTISNPITITGATSGSPVTSLSFSTTGSGVTINASAITLNGETRFANNGTSASQLEVNLAGINANGFCVEYLGFGLASQLDGPDQGFLNGPAGCVVSTPTAATTVAPGAPNTGLALVAAHPLASFAASTAAAFTILAIARRLKPLKR